MPDTNLHQSSGRQPPGATPSPRRSGRLLWLVGLTIGIIGGTVVAVQIAQLA